MSTLTIKFRRYEIWRWRCHMHTHATLFTLLSYISQLCAAVAIDWRPSYISLFLPSRAKCTVCVTAGPERCSARPLSSYWNRYDCARRANQKNRILKKKKKNEHCVHVYYKMSGRISHVKEPTGWKNKMYQMIFLFFITDVIFFLDVWAWKFGASLVLFVHLPISRLFLCFN